MKTYLFYDLETSGLDPCFDQIFTFAAVRTDTSLNILDKISLTINLRPDIIPSPYACITHCLTGEDLDQGVNEFSAAKEIHALFNEPGTVSIGYNSLGFDDEFIRFLFYRNLLEPYSHQYANGCFRMDLLPVTALFYLFSPRTLVWPTGHNSRPSLKLELISQENHFSTSGRAHEAMADVEALICLFQALSREERIFTYALDFFSADTDRKRMGKLDQRVQIGGQSFPMGLMISNSFGSEVNYMAPVICLGPSARYKKQMIWVRLDTEKTTSIHGETNLYEWFAVRKKFGDQWLILPCLDRFTEHLRSEAKAAWKASLAHFEKHQDIFLNTCEYHIHYGYPVIPNIDPDADLYQSGFFSPGQKADMNLFQNTPDKEKAAVALKLKSQRIRSLAQRIVDRNFAGILYSPEMMSHLEKLTLQDSSVFNYRNGQKMTKPMALKAISQIQKRAGALDSEQKRAFQWVSDYVRNFSV